MCTSPLPIVRDLCCAHVHPAELQTRLRVLSRGWEAHRRTRVGGVGRGPERTRKRNPHWVGN